jgi:hypothetical protein
MLKNIVCRRENGFFLYVFQNVKLGVTSVVILVNGEYLKIKKNTKPKKKLGIHDETQEIKELIINSGYPDKKLYDKANNLDLAIQLLL